MQVQYGQCEFVNAHPARGGGYGAVHADCPNVYATRLPLDLPPIMAHVHSNPPVPSPTWCTRFFCPTFYQVRTHRFAFKKGKAAPNSVRTCPFAISFPAPRLLARAGLAP